MKNLKTGILYLTIITVLIAVGLVFSCAQQALKVDIEKKEGASVVKEYFGGLTLTIINIKEGRTLYPSFITPTSYDISGDGPGAESFSFSNLTASTKNITNLVVGTWAITVKAKDASGKIIANGSNNSVVVVKDLTTDATVDINYLQTPTTGTGIVDLTIDWPDAIGIDDISLKIDTDATLDVYDGGASAIKYENSSIVSGSYIFVFKLKKDGAVLASVIESVHIYDNLTTSATITLTDAGFKKAPTAPSGLNVTEGLSKIELSWTDTSNIETGFIVERSTTSGSGFAQIGTTLAANTSTYEDTTAVTGTTYYYQVKSVNSFGSSTSSEANGKWEAPTATLSNKPANITNSTTAAITVGGTDVVAYKYKLDSPTYGSEILIATDNTIDLTGLIDGDHTIDVVGRDTVGNWQTIPTSWTWEVNTTSSIATLSNKPLDPTNSTSAAIVVGGTDIVSYKYKLDLSSYGSEIFIATDNTIDLSGLSNGSHTIYVIGKNSLNNWQSEASPTTYTWTVDTIAPTVTITSSATNPTKTSPIPVTITFSESVSDFVAGDITVGNGTATLSGSGTTYTANITPSGQGAVTVDIASGVARDAAGNTNEAATQLSRTYDSGAPTVTITSTETSPTKVDTIPITITFSESVTGFDAADITVAGGTKGALSGSGASYTMDITVATSGTVTIDITGGVCQDAAGNTNIAATQYSIVVQFQGAISLTINLITPSTFDVIWDGTGDLTLSQGEILDVTADITGATAWRWYMDGNVIPGETANNIDINTSSGNMDPGLHRLDVIVTKDSLEYSAYIKFEVNN